MELTISEVTRSFDVTARMLRHYEKMGLITPFHKEDYSYRCYDEENIRRLQLIIVMRKLRVPLKQIAEILRDGGRRETPAILRENIERLDGEIKSLNTVRKALSMLITRFDGCEINLLSDGELMETINRLSLSKNALKENIKMDELNKANETLSGNLNVRIIMLPPFTVASNHVIGHDPEEKVGEPVDKFIRDTRLYEIKPDSRFFGFNHPNPGILEEGIHGYEVWVTIPDEMEVPEPLVKKKFEGGLYAALTIRFPEFQFWGELENWVKNSDEYELNYSELGLEIMGGCLEEHLNWVYSAHMGWPENGIDGQLDLLMPVKRKGK